MKEAYDTPKVEILEFDYSDVILTSGMGTRSAGYNDDPNGQYYKCSNTSYYAPGWGLNC